MIEIRTHLNPWQDHLQILIREKHSSGRVSIADKLTMHEQEEGTITEPTMDLSPQAAQVLMDDLWASGIRPTEGSGSAGALRATEKHLADMRSIVFKKLGID